MMSIKIEELNKMIKRAKTKKDGVYSCNGNKYLVYRNGVAAFVGDDCAIYKTGGVFCTAISKKFRYRWDADDFLKKNKEKIFKMCHY